MRALVVICGALGVLGATAALAAWTLFPVEARAALMRARLFARRVKHAAIEAIPRPPLPPGTRSATTFTVEEAIYAKGLQRDVWQDYGWAPRELDGPGPAELRFAYWGGWIVARMQPTAPRFGGLLLKVKAPEDYGEFLRVSMSSDLIDNFPTVDVGPQHRRDAGDGWQEVFIPMQEMNPYGLDFNKITFHVNGRLPDAVVLLADIGLTKPTGPLPPPKPLPSRDAKAVLQCDKPGRAISPLIYGLAASDAPEELNAASYRWGGNPSSRYNFKIEAWNTAHDWYYQNVQGGSWQAFVDRAAKRNAYVTITVPMIGWVAKDTSSVSFPVSVVGPQESTDNWRPDAGNGRRKDGTLVKPLPPSTTSIPAPPEFVAEFVRKIREEDQRAGKRRVHAYILDNEPMLWNSTHRDVHPEPVTYDELLDRTIRYGSVIRKLDPDAKIVGPAVWGWPAYFFSAKDHAEGFDKKPDRRAHGDVPFLEWYLRKLREHEQRTGVRLLDVLDVHFYPQADGVYSDASDPATSALRLRSTRALWDPDYADESWINDKVHLIPRLRDIVARNYPGIQLSLGEWSFGAERHPSGGVAMAEALGRFAQQGLHSAYYWIAPPKDSPAYWAFRAFRNYDGAGKTFLNELVPVKVTGDVSVFASRDKARKRLVIVALNFSDQTEAALSLDFKTCGKARANRYFSYWGNREGLALQKGGGVRDGGASARLRPYAISVWEIEL